MSLQFLTTSGWIFYALTLAAVLTFVRDLTEKKKDLTAEVQPFAVALMVTWCLWLVTPS